MASKTLEYLSQFENITVVVLLHPIAGDIGKNLKMIH